MLRAVAFAVFLLSATRHHGCSQSYNAIYSFGDSIADTGNLCTGSGGCPSWLTTGQPPYGNTHFGHPTGRCTDGRVILDFLGIYICSTVQCALSTAIHACMSCTDMHGW
jgi:hypothetical protein